MEERKDVVGCITYHRGHMGVDVLLAEDALIAFILEAAKVQVPRGGTFFGGRDDPCSRIPCKWILELSLSLVTMVLREVPTAAREKNRFNICFLRRAVVEVQRRQPF